MKKYTGTVDALKNNVLSGWVRLKDDEENLAVRFKWREVEIFTSADRERKDLSADCRGFSFTVPHDFSIKNLLESKIEILTSDHSEEVSIWRPLSLAAELSVQGPRFTSAVLELLPSDEFGVLVNAMDQKTQRWPTNTARKKFAAVAYAHSADAWFPYFIKHYTQFILEEDIHIITPNPVDFSNYRCKIVATASRQFDDAVKSAFASNYANGLLSFYEWVGFFDVDEILIPDPRSQLSFMDCLDSLTQSVSFVRGYDILQLDEHDFDLSLPVLDQRKYGVPNMALSKPFLTKAPISWSGGHHYCNYRATYEQSGAGFWCLHLKWADRRMRQEVANVVEKVSYSQQSIANYAKSSLLAPHPILARKDFKIVPITDPAVAAFEMERLSTIKYNKERGMWLGRLDSADFIVEM